MLYHDIGSTEVLRHTSVADPEPGPADVIVEVAATAVNRLDVIQRNGWYQLPGFALPHISGMDVAGTVAAVGDEVDDVAIGERVVIDPSLTEVPVRSTLVGHSDLDGDRGVIGATVDGGYAELCLAPTSHVHPIPDDMDDVTAAVFPTAWMTAWHALVEIGRLRAGETVLIHAAGSGVSVAAIQLAHHLGARVLATAGSAAKCDRALELGVDVACNNRTDDVTAFARAATDGRGVDMVFDHVGPAVFASSFFAVAPRGRYVICGNTTGDEVTIPSLGHLFHQGVAVIGSDAYRHHEFADAWATYLAVRPSPAVDVELPLADAAEAHRRIESGTAFGKVVLRP